MTPSKARGSGWGRGRLGPTPPALTPQAAHLQVLLFLQEEKEEITAETQVTLVVAPRTLLLQRCGLRPGHM